jgi:hypothetical protein
MRIKNIGRQRGVEEAEKKKGEELVSNSQLLKVALRSSHRSQKADRKCP